MFRRDLSAQRKALDLQEENERLRAEHQALREELTHVKEALRQALARIEELEKHREPPAFVKANVKKAPAEEKKPRKKRESKHTRGRMRAVPTRIVEHRLVTCPSASASWEASVWHGSAT